MLHFFSAGAMVLLVPSNKEATPRPVARTGCRASQRMFSMIFQCARKYFSCSQCTASVNRGVVTLHMEDCTLVNYDMEDMKMKDYGMEDLKLENYDMEDFMISIHNIGREMMARQI